MKADEKQIQSDVVRWVISQLRSVFHPFKSVRVYPAPLLKKAGGGFTLIELVVVLAISALLVGGGFAAYTQFNERQTLLGAGKKLYSDLRLTQGKAASNEKPAGCEEERFEGMQLRFTRDDAYVVEALCGGEEVATGTATEMVAGVRLVDFSGSEAVRFYILGRGGTAAEWCVVGFGRYYKISVSAAGEIVEGGLVSQCP